MKIDNTDIRFIIREFDNGYTIFADSVWLGIINTDYGEKVFLEIDDVREYIINNLQPHLQIINVTWHEEVMQIMKDEFQELHNQYSDLL